ncbi:MAG TPA: hypothetical protein VIV09_09050 [Pseudolabrys sp.]|jgi:hypothetical protein
MSRLGSAAVILILCCTPALARWSPRYASQSPQVRNWFEQQHNARGQSCCDHGDGHAFYGDYTINPNGSVTVQLSRGPRTLPAYMVLQGVNPTGHAIYWYRDYGTARIDYCFSPGTLS